MAIKYQGGRKIKYIKVAERQRAGRKGEQKTSVKDTHREHIPWPLWGIYFYLFMEANKQLYGCTQGLWDHQKWEMISIQLFTLRLLLLWKTTIWIQWKALYLILKSTLPFLPQICSASLAEMVCGRFAEFCCRSDLGILLPRQSADCPRWQELTLKASAGVWKTSTPCVACACFSQAIWGGGS